MDLARRLQVFSVRFESRKVSKANIVPLVFGELEKVERPLAAPERDDGPIPTRLLLALPSDAKLD